MSLSEGPLCLIGGGEFTPSTTVDIDILTTQGVSEVVVLPTAAAGEHPEKVAARAAEHLAGAGVAVEGLMVLSRDDAEDPGMAKRVAHASAIYLTGGSPLHLRSVLKGTAVFEALVEAFASGALVIGSGAGALVLTDPMVDPRGGGLTVGLALVDGLAVVTEFEGHEPTEKLHRAVALAPKDLAVVGIPTGSALIKSGGQWRTSGDRPVVIYRNGEVAPDALGPLGA